MSGKIKVPSNNNRLLDAQQRYIGYVNSNQICSVVIC